MLKDGMHLAACCDVGPNFPCARAQMSALDAAQILMNGTLTSRNCGLSVQISAASVQVEKYYSKAVNYTLMMTAVSFFQVSEPARKTHLRFLAPPYYVALRSRACDDLTNALQVTALASDAYGPLAASQTNVRVLRRFYC